MEWSVYKWFYHIFSCSKYHNKHLITDSFQKHEQNHTIAIFHSSFISFKDLGEFVNVLKYYKYNFIVVNKMNFIDMCSFLMSRIFLLGYYTIL